MRWISLGAALSMVWAEYRLWYDLRPQVRRAVLPAVDPAASLPTRASLIDVAARINRVRRDTISFRGDVDQITASASHAGHAHLPLPRTGRTLGVNYIALWRAHLTLMDHLRDGSVEARSKCLQSRYGDAHDAPVIPIGPEVWVDEGLGSGKPTVVIPDYKSSSLVPLVDVERGVQVSHIEIEIDERALVEQLVLFREAISSSEHVGLGNLNRLKRVTTGWELCWAGERAQLPGSQGVAMVAVLVSSPFRWIDWRELRDAADRVIQHQIEPAAALEEAIRHRGGSDQDAAQQKGLDATSDQSVAPVVNEAERARQGAFHAINRALLLIAVSSPAFIRHFGLIKADYRRALSIGEKGIRYAPRSEKVGAWVRLTANFTAGDWTVAWEGAEVPITPVIEAEAAGLMVVWLLCSTPGVAQTHRVLAAVPGLLRSSFVPTAGQSSQAGRPARPLAVGSPGYESAERAAELDALESLERDMATSATLVADGVRRRAIELEVDAALTAIQRSCNPHGGAVVAFFQLALVRGRTDMILQPGSVRVEAHRLS